MYVVVDSEGLPLAEVAAVEVAMMRARMLDRAVAVLTSDGVILAFISRDEGKSNSKAGERAVTLWRQRQPKQRRRVA